MGEGKVKRDGYIYKVMSFFEEKFTSHRLLKFVSFSFSHHCLWLAFYRRCYYLVFDLLLVSNFIIGFLNHFLTLMTVNVHFALHLTFGISYRCWLFKSLWIFICFLMVNAQPAFWTLLDSLFFYLKNENKFTLDTSLFYSC